MLINREWLLLYVSQCQNPIDCNLLQATLISYDLIVYIYIYIYIKGTLWFKSAQMVLKTFETQMVTWTDFPAFSTMRFIKLH